MRNPHSADAIRKTLEIIRDELRTHSSKYEDLRHEKLVSPLAVSTSSWRAFATANRSNDADEQWHVVEEGGWLGRFTGDLSGVTAFTELDNIFKHVSHTSLLDVVHDLAWLQLTPLVKYESYVWGWKPDEHLEEDAETYLHQHADLSDEDASYPKHPLVQRLSRNIYFCSAVAIDFVLTPALITLQMPFLEDDTPLTLQDLTEDAATLCSVSPTTETDPTEEAEGDYVFRKKGDLWFIRFKEGNIKEEGFFKHSVGLRRYANLLQSPHINIPNKNYAPSPPVEVTGSTMNQKHAKDSTSDDDASWYSARTNHYKLDAHDLSERKRAVKEMQTQRDNESDPLRKKELHREIRRIERELYTGYEVSNELDQVLSLQNTIKQSLYRTRTMLQKHNMHHLASHLEAYVQAEQAGYTYRPSKNILWMT